MIKTEILALPLDKLYPSIRAIVEEYLHKHKFDGLWDDDGGGCACACEITDLAPCGEPNYEHCRVGYKTKCPRSCGEHDFHIVARKPRKRND